MWKALCSLIVFTSAYAITDFKSDLVYNATYIKNDIISHISHLFPSINSNIMSHIKSAEEYKLSQVRATIATISQRNTPFFSWMDAKYALSINRIIQCNNEQIRLFSCADCDEMKLKFLYQSPSNKNVRVIIVSTETFFLVGFHQLIKDISFLSDITTAQIDFPCIRCKVNKDFYNQFSELVDQVVDALTELHEQDPNVPIYISGHSVGGTLATLFSVYVTINYPVLPITHVFTFGSPRVGNIAFANTANKILGERWFRVMNQLDIVSSVPPTSFGYQHIGQLMLCNTGTTVCIIKGRNEENEGGVHADLLRLTESASDINKCHLTYWKEAFVCTSK